MSDQDPIVLSLDISIDNLTTFCHGGNKPNKLCWYEDKDSSLLIYRRRVSSLLRSIDCPVEVLNCCDPLCDQHGELISKYCDDLEKCLLDAGERSIPKAKPAGTRVPGWSEFVREYRDASIFWHAI